MWHKSELLGIFSVSENVPGLHLPTSLCPLLNYFGLLPRC